jgi:hypothetical protein
MIRPFLKVTEKRKSTGRRRGKSTIPTDTSEKLAIGARKSVKPAKIAQVTRKIEESSSEDEGLWKASESSDDDFDMNQEIFANDLERRLTSDKVEENGDDDEWRCSVSNNFRLQK